MKLRDIDPKVTPFRWGADRNVGKWSYVDLIWFPTPNDHTNRCELREVRHYGTLMGSFVRTSPIDGGAVGEWRFEPYSVGWGSVSDQQGINKIIHGYGLRFVRKGGARYVATNNSEGN